MWLLRVDCTELRFFHSPEAVEEDGGFAALSHVWDEEELTFQDVRRIQEACAKDGTDPRGFVSEKIRRCCELAERQGYKWAWMDLCCIDKTSSAELSEAINSMFRYYALAQVCYGHLRDVTLSRPRGRNLSDHEKSQFRDSVWLKRGWTLQELIAPRFFLFVNDSWDVLGSKADFAELLESVTGIPARVLQLEVSQNTFSIAQRMSWYGDRRTTRLEDEAYCLLGLFDIQIPPLYGEGRKAFRRLQEEIMKQSPDTTLFAWHLYGYSQDWLFAEEPRHFKDCSCVRYTPPQHTEQTSNAVNEISFALTPRGVLAHVPVVECGEATYADLYWSDPEHRLLTLRLDNDDGAANSSARPLYNVQRFTRCKLVAGEFEENTARASWQDVLIRDSRPLPHLPGQLLQDTRTPFVSAIPVQLALDAPFRFDEHHIRKLAHAMRDDETTAVSIHKAVYQLPGQSDSALSTLYVFHFSSFFVIIELGQCRKVASPTPLSPHEDHAQASPRSAPDVWARVCYIKLPESDINKECLRRLPAHDCREDHVSQWPGSKRVFHIPEWNLDSNQQQSCLSMVTLSFSPCPINERTLILDASYHEEDSIPSNSCPAIDISSFIPRSRSSNDNVSPASPAGPSPPFESSEVAVHTRPSSPLHSTKSTDVLQVTQYTPDATSPNRPLLEDASRLTMDSGVADSGLTATYTGASASSSLSLYESAAAMPHTSRDRGGDMQVFPPVSQVLLSQSGDRDNLFPLSEGMREDESGAQGSDGRPKRRRQESESDEESAKRSCVEKGPSSGDGRSGGCSL